MKKLLNSLYIGLVFTSISLLSTYWAKGSIAGDGSYPWLIQFLVLWIACSLLIYCIDKIFGEK